MERMEDNTIKHLEKRHTCKVGEGRGELRGSEARVGGMGAERGKIQFL